ncbi:MAG TPA: Scr1 family TA system antitoxin-like transcriptional regulator [Pseudonocardiaceae bacterium]
MTVSSGSSGSPTVLKRWVAFELRRLRETRHLGRDAAAKSIHGSVSQIGHIETGRSLPKPLELEKLLEIYGVPERADFFLRLRDAAKKGRDWWIGFEGAVVPEWFELYLGLESSATKIEGWDAQVIPGLLQTPEYAEAVIRAGEPDLPDDEVTRRVQVRIGRQREVLDRADPPKVWSVLHEGALRTTVGGPEIMRAQLDKLVELSRRPNITLQVLPFAAGAHPGGDGTFAILSFPAELEFDPGAVYVQTRITGYYYEQPDELARYRDDLTRLQIQAIKPEQTPAFIHRIAEDL